MLPSMRTDWRKNRRPRSKEYCRTVGQNGRRLASSCSYSFASLTAGEGEPVFSTCRRQEDGWLERLFLIVAGGFLNFFCTGTRCQFYLAAPLFYFGAAVCYYHYKINSYSSLNQTKPAKQINQPHNPNEHEQPKAKYNVLHATTEVALFRPVDARRGVVRRVSH